VSEEARKLVQAALLATGYRPNMVARSLRTNRSNTIGLVLSDTWMSEFFAFIAHVVQSEALARGYTVLTLNSKGDAETEATGVSRLLDHNVDAIIFCTASSAQNVASANRRGIPTVQIERERARVGNLVLVDPTNGMQQAVAHLVGLGHERIAFMGGVGPIGADLVETERLQSFVGSLVGHGIVARPEYLKHGHYYWIKEGGPFTGYKLMRELLDLPTPPSAVICGSDFMAATSLQAINESGLRCPQDISVIGYNDSMAEMLTPPLSSIAQPISELGREAVKLAINALEASDPSRTIETVSTVFVRRQSTAAPADRKQWVGGATGLV
jgi:DNA-binding LacI/PurR family transcriptional regulator